MTDKANEIVTKVSPQVSRHSFVIVNGSEVPTLTNYTSFSFT